MQWGFSPEQINWDLQDHRPEEFQFLKDNLSCPETARHTPYNDFVFFHVVNPSDLDVVKRLILKRLGREEMVLPPDNSPLWDEFIHWAKKFHEWDQFDEQERTYKLEIAKNMQVARSALESGSDEWLRLLKRAYGPPNNLTSFYSHGKFLDWCSTATDAVRSALADLWSGEDTVEERYRRFLLELPKDALAGDGTRANVVSLLLTGVNAENFPNYKATAFHDGYRKTEFARPDLTQGEFVTYTHALGFLDRMVEEAGVRDLTLRDRLDAQSVLRCVTHWGPLDHWSDHDRRAFIAYRDNKTLPPPPEPTLEKLAGDLLLDHTYLKRVDALLQSKKQIIFYGPPGTGKTYVARELAKHYAGKDGSFELVQFHPSYAYEDFIEGYRPHLVNGQPGFQLAEGPLKRIAQEAREDPEAKYILVIDEINRGNVAKVLGELYFLLEYRDEDISLQYSSEPFSLPPNLWIIGTMNTADRSIALIDAAMRRRFYFVPFMPDETPINGLLKRWLDRNKPELAWVAGVVDQANQMMGDRHMAIGPSYFMKADLDERWVDLIWEHSILPYIAEQFFGEESRLDEFRLDRLRGLNTPAMVEPDAPVAPE